MPVPEPTPAPRDEARNLNLYQTPPMFSYKLTFENTLFHSLFYQGVPAILPWAGKVVTFTWVRGPTLSQGRVEWHLGA